MQVIEQALLPVTIKGILVAYERNEEETIEHRDISCIGIVCSKQINKMYVMLEIEFNARINIQIWNIITNESLSKCVNSIQINDFVKVFGRVCNGKVCEQLLS